MVCASFWRGVLYWVHERESAGVAAPAPTIDQSPSGTSTGRVSLLGPSLDHVPDGAGVRAQDAEVSLSHQVISVDELARSPPCSTAAPNASDAGAASAASPGP